MIPLVSSLSNIEQAFRVFKNLKTFFKTVITKHRDTFDSKNIRDCIDSYIYEQNSRLLKDPNTTFCGKFHY
ncbi:hypothetical protein JTE90_007786 [Oedothorax gibbosus]|uniref:Uncharacterized protein n=1 Tax=Oedothorax gibbosus TaxID=931172 RepID=A0AAV6TSB5_9ARAC|nr:hypothetical protein JTE90_007786 [Oedothorax gibbosus]